jgi:hypothetical protein
MFHGSFAYLRQGDRRDAWGFGKNDTPAGRTRVAANFTRASALADSKKRNRTFSRTNHLKISQLKVIGLDQPFDMQFPFIQVAADFQLSQA